MTTDRRAGLESRIQALEDHQAIVETITRYARTIDYGPDDEWLDCFTDGAAIDICYRQGASLARAAEGTRHANGVRHVGGQQLAAFKAGHSRAPTAWHKHVVSPPSVELDGDEATASTYMLRMDEVDGVLCIRSFGRYRDRLARCADGVWRFVERVVEVEAIDRARHD